MFVGDVHNGRLYRFDLNQERTGLVLPEALADKVIPTPTSPGLEDIIFGQGFAGITDIEVGPDGYLYVVSIGQGKIFRIVPGAPEAAPAPLSFPEGEQVPAVDEDEQTDPAAEEDDGENAGDSSGGEGEDGSGGEGEDGSDGSGLFG